MKFECICTDIPSKARFALMFLKEAHEQGLLSTIENIDSVFECLDISNDLEYAQNKLKENNIDY